MSYHRHKSLTVRAAKIMSADEKEATFDIGDHDDGQWLAEALEKDIGQEGGIWVLNDGIRIGTLSGTLRADPGDYIVCGTNGELIPVKADMFAQLYEPLARTG